VAAAVVEVAVTAVTAVAAVAVTAVAAVAVTAAGVASDLIVQSGQSARPIIRHALTVLR